MIRSLNKDYHSMKGNTIRVHNHHTLKSYKFRDFIVNTVYLLLGTVILSCWMILHALVVSGLGFDFFLKLV